MGDYWYPMLTGAMTLGVWLLITVGKRLWASRRTTSMAEWTAEVEAACIERIHAAIHCAEVDKRLEQLIGEVPEGYNEAVFETLELAERAERSAAERVGKGGLEYKPFFGRKVPSRLARYKPQEPVETPSTPPPKQTWSRKLKHTLGLVPKQQPVAANDEATMGDEILPPPYSEIHELLPELPDVEAEDDVDFSELEEQEVEPVNTRTRARPRRVRVAQPAMEWVGGQLVQRK